MYIWMDTIIWFYRYMKSCGSVYTKILATNPVFWQQMGLERETSFSYFMYFCIVSVSHWTCLTSQFTNVAWGYAWWFPEAPNIVFKGSVSWTFTYDTRLGSRPTSHSLPIDIPVPELFLCLHLPNILVPRALPNPSSRSTSSNQAVLLDYLRSQGSPPLQDGQDLTMFYHCVWIVYL